MDYTGLIWNVTPYRWANAFLYGLTIALFLDFAFLSLYAGVRVLRKLTKPPG